MDGPGGHHPEWGNTFTKGHSWYSLTDKWILDQKLRIPKIQFAKLMKFKKEDQCVDTSFLLWRGNKIPMEGVTETNFGAETEGKTTQRLAHLGTHPINNHQKQTLLHIPTRFCWQDPDIAIFCAWQIQKWMLTVIYWMEHRVPNEGARESTQRAEGVCCNPIGGKTIWTNQYPQSLCI